MSFGDSAHGWTALHVRKTRLIRRPNVKVAAIVQCPHGMLVTINFDNLTPAVRG